MYTLKWITSTNFDETVLYNVELDKEYTVDEFIKTIVSNKRDWGKISVNINNSNSTIEYKYGKLKSDIFTSNILNYKVKSVKSTGGWSNMNYYITI